MKYFKQIEGEKSYLSPLHQEDAETYCEWLNDLTLSMYLQPEFSLNVQEEEEAIKELRKKDKIFAIIDRKTDRLIGNCGLHGLNGINQTAGFGIFIGDKGYWNKGYGEEATKLTLDYGFNVLNLHNIMLMVYSYNTRAVACYEKCGFACFGTRREAKFFAGEYYDILYMDILSSEFESPVVKSIIGDSGY